MFVSIVVIFFIDVAAFKIEKLPLDGLEGNQIRVHTSPKMEVIKWLTKLFVKNKSSLKGR